MNNIFAGILPFLKPETIRFSGENTASLPHPRKKGPGRSSRMRRKNNPAGTKFARAFASKVATHRGKFRHLKK